MDTGWKFAWTTLMRELAPQSKDGTYVRPSYAFQVRTESPVYPNDGTESVPRLASIPGSHIFGAWFKVSRRAGQVPSLRWQGLSLVRKHCEQVCQTNIDEEDNCEQVRWNSIVHCFVVTS